MPCFIKAIRYLTQELQVMNGIEDVKSYGRGAVSATS